MAKEELAEGMLGMERWEEGVLVAVTAVEAESAGEVKEG